MFTQIATAITALTAYTGLVSASPMFGLKDVQAGNLTTLKARDAAPAAPHFVIYSDKWVTGAAPAVSDINGYNVFALSFLTSNGAVDQATNWASLTDDQRSSIKSSYSAAGIKLVVSAFGSTEEPTTSGVDAVSTANTMAAWVKQYNLDGIDVDYEDLDAFNKGDGSAEQWLIDFTNQLRVQLPASDYILTHAPLAPWFTSDTSKYPGGGYLKVNSEVGSKIDWYNIQFYNQGTSEYVDCNGLLTASSSAFPGTAVFQIIASGVSSDKVLIGKPATAADATNGYIDPATLATCVSQATGQGWKAGVMVWEYPDAAASWIATVKGSSF